MKGCKGCPAYAKCTVIYRSSSCDALRATYGINTDPEIETNADRIRSMSDEKMAKELIDMVADLCEDGVPCYDLALEWLRKPVDED